MLDDMRRLLPPLIGLILFIAALEVLRTELRAVTWRELSRDVFSTPHWRLAIALLLTTANYAVLTCYDFLAFAYTGARLSARRIALASFLSYAIANNVGFAMLSGASVRYRFYTRWGISAGDLSRIVFSYSVTFWLGLLLLGGLSLASSPLPDELGGPARGAIVPLGIVLILVSLGYVVAATVRRSPIRVGRVELPLPSPAIAASQLAVSVVDWILAGAVLFVLLPASHIPFLAVLGAFLAAQLLGLVSNVPGGVGVFESLMVILLRPFIATPELLPALVVYRAVYYLVPLTVALVLLVGDLVHQRRDRTASVGAAIGRLTELLTPRMLATFTFLSGIILLFSGATPAAAGRLAMLHRVFPLGVIETSHFIGSIVGAVLLVLSQGLARRLDAAYFASLIMLLVGIAASLLKGADVEEATVLTFLLGLLWYARPEFNRRAAFFETRFSFAWIVAVVGAIMASIWLGLFAFKHIEYSTELWWQFELHGEASRFLRASTGAAVVLLVLTLARLIRHAPHEVTEPADAELDAAAAIIAGQSSTSAYLVYLRDKGLIFDERRQGFVMYGAQGRTWVALEPVGPPEWLGDLIRVFLERCDDFGGIPVFYEVRKDYLYRYADFGLAFVKLGEEGTIDLRCFTLEGGSGSRNRQALRRLQKDGATFRIIPAAKVGSVMEQLRQVSDEWLEAKSAGEKGFSLGFFKPDYLARFPAAVIERGTRIVAFANVWEGPDKAELSVDLMRYRRDAPRDVMESLFVHLMLWGKEQGYQSFSLGMAPLAGFERSAVAPLWNRLGAFLYEHGEAFYNFQGLRAYKEKFNPRWEPRYLVYPGGLKLPRILADVAALVAGGYRRILVK